MNERKIWNMKYSFKCPTGGERWAVTEREFDTIMYDEMVRYNTNPDYFIRLYQIVPLDCREVLDLKKYNKDKKSFVSICPAWEENKYAKNNPPFRIVHYKFIGKLTIAEHNKGKRFDIDPKIWKIEKPAQAPDLLWSGLQSTIE